MVDLKFEMNFGAGWVKVPPPRNWKAMKIQTVFDGKVYQSQLQSINFEWVKENAVKIYNYYKAGLTGGTGIFEGIGLRIFAGSISPQQIFLGCIETAHEAFDIQKDFITCPIKESGKIDWMNTQAQSITFEYLTSLAPGTPGRITRSDYKQTPYAISSIPDYTQAMLLSISLFIIIKESVDCVAKIASLVTRAISQSLSWLQLIGTIVEIVLYLIYLVAIVVASAKLMQQIADNLLQPIKRKLCMREVDLFKKGCEYFGLNFVSSIYGEGTADRYEGRYVGATLMPVKIKIPDGDPALQIFERPPDETTNPKSYGYYEGTFKQFIDDMEQMYHAKLIIIGNTAYFEEINNWNVADSYRLPNEGDVGNTFLYPEPYGTNAHEIPAVYIIRFQKDEQDLNTYNDYKGTYVISQATPAIVNNPKNQLLHGNVRVELPFALARRKVGYTKLEKALLELLNTCATFINSIGDRVDNINDKLSSWMPSIVSAEDVGLSNTQVGIAVGFLTGQPVFSVLSIVLGSDGLPIMPSVTIPFFGNDRIGWMLLSSDFIGVKKRFIGVQSGDDWFLSPNNSQGTFVTTITSTLNGTFTGNSIGGPFGPTVIAAATVTSGIIQITIPTAMLGPASVIVTGTVAGYPGVIFTAVVTGVMTGGFFNGFAVLNVSASSTITTEGWGSALSLMNDFHFNALISDNQWLVFKNKKFKFGIADWLQINNNNVLRTADGRYGKFEKIVWNLHNDIAEDVTYRIKEKYTNNYNLKTTSDGG